MYKIGLLLILYFFLPGNVVFSQVDSASVYFEETHKTFGHLYEADGNKIIKFNFRNEGNSPLVISRVIAPGFYSVNYKRDSIFPGEAGEITAAINPYGKVGYFDKEIMVFSNADNSPSALVVSGRIIHGSFTGSFKHNVGGLAFKQAQLNFGYIYNGHEPVRFIPVMNTGKKTIAVRFIDAPNHLLVVPRFDSLTPGEKAMIEVKYNTRNVDDWDFVIDRVRLVVETKNREKTEGLISITANIREDFSVLSEEDKELKPKVSIPVKVYNFDTIPKDHITFYNFLIINNGGRPLDIRAVKPTCGCTAVMPVKNSVAPGDSTYIKVAFDSKGFTGQNKKGVTVITNDPENYKQFLWVTGYVEE